MTETFSQYCHGYKKIAAEMVTTGTKLKKQC